MNTYVVIPAYNEAARIGDVVKKTVRMVTKVIVVDDGSFDGTSQIARREGAEVIRLGTNRGVGYALIVGLQAALAQGADILVTMDGDGQHLPEELPELLKPVMEGYEACLTYRLRGRERMPAIRRILNWGTNTIIRLIAGKRFKDSLCGYRAFKTDTIRKIMFRHDGYGFVPGIAINTALLGVRYLEIPVRCVYLPKLTSYRNGDLPRALVLYAHFLWAKLRGRSRHIPDRRELHEHWPRATGSCLAMSESFGA